MRRLPLGVAAGLLSLALGLAARGPALASDPDSVRELGRVRWERDFEAGLARARRDGQPLFLLFQEVPGCATCVGFGEQVLSHPLLVDAIETEFVAVAIFNNHGGEDRRVLQRFGEPAWNNPVVRFVDGEGRDLLPRKPGVWPPYGISRRMIATLERAGRPVPAYLRLAAEEARGRRPQRAVLETHCFWETEVCAAGLPGVVATEAVWLEGREGVEVHFDPRATSYADLLQRARETDCARGVWSLDPGQVTPARRIFGERAKAASQPPRRARESDQKRHLRASPLAQLDLTPLQATRTNAALARGGDPTRWLSPRQRERLAGLARSDQAPSTRRGRR